MARDYDELFTRSMIGRAQRNAVWSVLLAVFPKGSHLLELNCGTGEDALFLARNGISVTACDASSQMIDVASSRLRQEAPGAPISFNHLSIERIRELRPAADFDGAFSNFSGLNCVADLERDRRRLGFITPARCPTSSLSFDALLHLGNPLVLIARTISQGLSQVARPCYGTIRRAHHRRPLPDGAEA